MAGELEDVSVFVRDIREGNQLYSKGNFGYPLHGGGLELDLVEAVFLVECERFEVVYKRKKMAFEDLFEYASRACRGFDIKYTVYRDLRGRGFVVKPESGSFDLCVYPRGQNVSSSAPLYMVCAVSERTALDITVFAREISQTADRGKQLLYGVVDEEGDLTYYNMSFKDPRGQLLPGERVPAVTGKLFGDRVFVFDAEAGRTLHEEAFYGKDLQGLLQLSLIEACYLIGTGELRVLDQGGKAMSGEELVKFGRQNQDEFDLRLRTYTDLRLRGLVVKTGFKYGTHFRVYEGSPDECHARYLVHAVPASHVTMWPEISRTVRLSGGVKKEILFCRVSEQVEYLEFKWFRP
ncbi:MAG: tRNA-intron lyase [Methanomethylophilus sp.]